jgi:chromosome partitioning protein
MPNTSEEPRILAVANQKGGVGKTTTAVNLATALTAVGKKVLLVDLDPQGNASTGLGIARNRQRKTVYNLLFDNISAEDMMAPTRVPKLYVVPSSMHLAGAEIELVNEERREYRLREKLRACTLFDYVIIDCPPSLSLLTLNAFVAAHAVVVPLQCEFYALEGLSQLTRTIERVQKQFNPELDLHGILLTMYDARNSLTLQVEGDVRSHFDKKVYKTVIPRNVRLSEAPSYGLPAIIYDMRCSGAQAYIRLASEIIRREKKLHKEIETQKQVA